MVIQTRATHPPVKFIYHKLRSVRAKVLAMSQKSIGNIDTGDVPENKDMNILCLNLGQKYIEFVCGQAQLAVRLKSFGMMVNWGPILLWVSGMKVCPGDYPNGCNGALDAVDDGVDC